MESLRKYCDCLHQNQIQFEAPVFCLSSAFVRQVPHDAFLSLCACVCVCLRVHTYRVCFTHLNSTTKIKCIVGKLFVMRSTLGRTSFLPSYQLEQKFKPSSRNATTKFSTTKTGVWCQQIVCVCVSLPASPPSSTPPQLHNRNFHTRPLRTFPLERD